MKYPQYKGYEETRFLADAPAIKEGKIVGYAAVFNMVSDPIFGIFEETIDPGAFANCDLSDVRGIFNHNPDNVLGRTKSGTLSLSIDERGLRYEIDPPDTQDARDLMTKIGRGDISGSSFMFVTPDGGIEFEDTDKEIVKSRIMKITRVKDVGPVTFPAYPDTTAGVRSLNGLSSGTTEIMRSIMESRKDDKTEPEETPGNSNMGNLQLAELETRIRTI